MNLGEHVSFIFDIIRSKEFLTHLDLSWAKLTPKNLNFIATELLLKHSQLRSLNISYNTLAFEENLPEDKVASEDFIDNFKAYLDLTETLVHLDISGLNLGSKQL